jgi:hypothetical protein
MFRTSRFVVCLAAVGALTLASCGGDDSNVSTSDSTKSSDAKVAGTDLSTDGSTSDSVTEESSDTTSPNFSGDDSGDLCSYAKKIEASSGDLLDDPSNFSEDLKEFRKIYDTAIDKAPSEIKGDLKTAFGAADALFSLMEKFDGDYTKMAAAAENDPDVAKALADFDNAEVQAAGERVDAYFTKVCGLDDSTANTTG